MSSSGSADACDTHPNASIASQPERNTVRFIAGLRGKFTICLGLAGSERPARFETSPGSGHALEELVRVANARPQVLMAERRNQWIPFAPRLARASHLRPPLPRLFRSFRATGCRWN